MTDDEYIKAIGNRIKKLRKEQDMTQLDLAVNSGMEENAVQRIETGRTNPTIKTLLKISRGLSVDVSEVILDITSDKD